VTSANKAAAGTRWRRPQAVATGPNRSFGGYYRTADRTLKGRDFRGVPLQAAEDVAVAAVRMGYQVVDAQIDRGLEMARRLRGAADRAGVGNAADLQSQTESLLMRGLFLGLELLESAGTGPNNPLKRLLAAEFRILGSMFGLTGPDAPGVDRTAGAASAQGTADRAGAPESRPKASRPIRIRHSEGSTQRAVVMVRWELHGQPPQPPSTHALRFYLTSTAGSEYLRGMLTLSQGAAPLLEIVTSDDTPSGLWRAAICHSDGEQLGLVELEL
jgi:hypothetical protein